MPWDPVISMESPDLQLVKVVDRNTGKTYEYRVRDWAKWLQLKKQYYRRPRALINELKKIAEANNPEHISSIIKRVMDGMDPVQVLRLKENDTQNLTEVNPTAEETLDAIEALISKHKGDEIPVNTAKDLLDMLKKLRKSLDMQD